MEAKDIKKVLIIGSGTMGKHIGLQHALFGCDVTMYDIDDKVLDKALTHISKIASRLARQGYITEERAKEAVGRIKGTANIAEACKGAQLVSESVPENVALKQKVWKEFDEYLPADAVLTTNTSTLVASQFAAASGRPSRFLAWHFHLPVYTANVVDVMPHEGTDPEITQLIIDFSRRINQQPIFIKKEWAHYVYNEMLTAFLSAAKKLAVYDVATIEDIDRAWMAIMNTQIGPFGIMDSVGLDTVLHITKESLNLTPDDPVIQDTVKFLQAKVDKGELGMKTGKGFYNYPNPEYADPKFVERVKPIYK